MELFHPRSDDFDLIITDVTMAQMTGDKLAREAESPTMTYRRHFTRVFDFSPIYRKI